MPDISLKMHQNLIFGKGNGKEKERERERMKGVEDGMKGGVGERGKGREEGGTR